LIRDTAHLRLRLEAAGRGELFETLSAAADALLAGRYRIDRLAAVGRQGYLFTATDLERRTRVAVKQPAFDYDRPIALTRDVVAQGRAAVAREHAVLAACTPCAFPEPVALIEAAHAVPRARSCAALGSLETYLVEELIDGETLTLTALRRWPHEDAPTREHHAAAVATAFLGLWRRARDAAWHYSDVSADNILVERATGRVRVVDAGSCVPAGGEVRLGGYSPAFMTPHLLERVTGDLLVPGTIASVLPPLAKVLHFALTRREPLAGVLPDARDSAMRDYTPACRNALAAMLAVDQRPDAERALRTLEAWTASA
jgi:hypothetical protein